MLDLVLVKSPVELMPYMDFIREGLEKYVGDYVQFRGEPQETVEEFMVKLLGGRFTHFIECKDGKPILYSAVSIYSIAILGPVADMEFAYAKPGASSLAVFEVVKDWARLQGVKRIITADFRMTGSSTKTMSRGGFKPLFTMMECAL